MCFVGRESEMLDLGRLPPTILLLALLKNLKMKLGRVFPFLPEVR